MTQLPNYKALTQNHSIKQMRQQSSYIQIKNYDVKFKFIFVYESNEKKYLYDCVVLFYLFVFLVDVFKSDLWRIRHYLDLKLSCHHSFHFKKQ